MKVTATQVGFHDHRRRYPGDVFVLRPITNEAGVVILTPEQQFSKNWMKKVAPSVPEVSRPKTVISPGNLDEVERRNQAKHKTIEQHQAEVAAAKEANLPEEESERAGSEAGASAGSVSSGDEDLI